MMFGTVIARLRQEVLNLKQLIQRSSATIATKSINITVPVTIDSSGTGVAYLYLVNVSETPMFFDIRFNLQTIKNTLGQYATPFYNHYSVDKDNPLNPVVAIGIVAPAGSDLIGRTFNLDTTIVATADFTAEVL